MRSVIAAAALLLASSAFVEQFTFDSISYGLEKLGANYIIYQRTYVASTHDVSTLTQNNCAELERTIAAKKDKYHVCEDQPNSSFCRILRNDIAFLSKEENFQNPSLNYSARRSWKLIIPSPAQEDALKAFVARQFSLNQDDLVYQQVTRNNSLDPFTVSLHADSLLQTVTRIVPLGSDSLESPQIVGSELKANNRFFACDLVSKRLSLASSFSATIKHEKRYDQSNVDVLWQIYRRVRNLMQEDEYLRATTLFQTALIGSEITAGLHDSNRALEGDFALLTILAAWFEESSGSLQLKQFSTRNEFNDALYPDQVFSKDVEIQWSVQ